MTADELDPITIRKGLDPMKRRGIPFEQAWTFVVGPERKRGKQAEDGPLRDFMKKHFRAAYLNLPTSNGRFRAPTIEGRESRPRVPVESGPGEQRCKSGDECTRRSGHGHFGSFCKHHADELALIDLRAMFNGSSQDAEAA